MRCQKVRSYLSAYCNDELAGRKKLAVDEHLSTCALCRKEESLYNAMFAAKSEIGSLEVSNDFNNNLLNRIANERFAETRTKAYHPQRPPLMVWSKVVPAVVSAFVVVFALVTLFSGGIMSNRYNYASQNNNLDEESVDNTLIMADESGVENGEMSLIGNTSPSAAGLAAKANLEAKGWVVLVS